jgi:hemolysin D
LLVELDPTESEVDKEQILQALNAARMEAHRLEVTLRKLDGEKSEMTPIDGVDPILFREQQQKMQADLDEYHASLAVLKSQGKQVEAERQAKLAEVGKLEALLPIIEEQEQAFRTLLERKMGSRLRWLEVKRELIEHRQELLVLHRQVEELDAAFQAGIERRKQLKETLRKTVSGERLEVLQRITQAQLELKAAETRERRNRLLSPVDGVVEELTVHTVGGVVRPADVLMKIVPEGTSLEVEAVVLNKDVGIVHKGQEVEVKLESFPFTKYGLVEGTITKLSADAILDERKGLVYPVRVALSDTRIQVDDGWVSLKSGMAVTAEIKTGRRRLIEFFLAPLLKYRGEALRER